MKRPTATRKERGFSLVEMVVALSVFAFLAALAVPLFGSWVSFDRPRRAARVLVGDLNRARSLAVSGYRPSGAPSWTAGDRTVNAGIVIASSNTYSIYVDRDGSADGDEYTIAVVTLPDPLTISAPPVGTEIRFKQNGATAAASIDIVLSDNTRGLDRSVTVSGAGLTWMN